MAKIVLVVDEKNNLLSMFVDKEGEYSKSFVNQQSGDNKAIVEDYRDVLHALALFTGQEIRYVEKGNYGNKATDLKYFVLEIPISECGKYLLLDNPLAK